MYYNLKMIEFPNGEIQFRYYDTPMKHKDVDVEEPEPVGVNPFRNEYVNKWKYEFPWERVRTAQDMEESKRKSETRTKNKIYEYSRCAKWEYFVTITFNQEKVDRYDFSVCSSKVRRWLNNQQQRYSPDLKYLVVPEQHNDGAWHFHGLLADVGSMIFTDSGVKTCNNDIVYNMSKWKFGFTSATAVNDTGKVSKYISKYVTKSLCDCTFGKRRYFVSSNITSPAVSTFFIDKHENVHDFVEKLGNSMGVSIDYVSKTHNNDFLSVEYFECS